MQTIKHINEFEDIKKREKAVLVYFSHEKCNICKVLKPKISEMLAENFPEMKMYYVDTLFSPETAGQLQIFSVPTIICLFEGTETIRKSRNIGIEELMYEIKRPYDMVTES
jgi:thioredoxin-like negative regulator of GroEL